MTHQNLPTSQNASEPLSQAASVPLVLSNSVTHGFSLDQPSPVGFVKSSFDSSPAASAVHSDKAIGFPTSGRASTLIPLLRNLKPAPSILAGYTGARRQRDVDMEPDVPRLIAQNHLGEDDDILDDPGIKRLVSFGRAKSSFLRFMLRLVLYILLWIVSIAAVTVLLWMILKGISLEECRTYLQGWWKG